MRLKLLQKELFKKTPEASGDLITNKINNKIKKNSKKSQQNNSETLTNEYEKEIP